MLVQLIEFFGQSAKPSRIRLEQQFACEVTIRPSVRIYLSKSGTQRSGIVDTRSYYHVDDRHYDSEDQKLLRCPRIPFLYYEEAYDSAKNSEEERQQPP
jgi:hypothetical protein